MKTNKLSSLVLKYMVKSYHDNHKDLFTFSSLLNAFPNVNKEEMKMAISALNHDNMTSTSYFDNEPGNITLSIQAIISIEEDTLIKKGYSFIKEIKSLL